jgi:hypothetical protein
MTNGRPPSGPAAVNTSNGAAAVLGAAGLDQDLWRRRALRLPPCGCRALEHDGLNCFRLDLRQAVMRSASGMNSLHSRITSGVQRSAASEAWAAARSLLAATINTVSTPAIAHSSDRDGMLESFLTLVPCLIECRRSLNNAARPEIVQVTRVALKVSIAPRSAALRPGTAKLACSPCR